MALEVPVRDRVDLALRFSLMKPLKVLPPDTPPVSSSPDTPDTGEDQTVNNASNPKPNSAKNKRITVKEGYSANELFFLLTTANSLDVYGAPFKERTQTWDKLYRAHRAKGYIRPLSSLKRKLEELLRYHEVCACYLRCHN